MALKIPKKIRKDIESGKCRAKFGLETDSGSEYFRLRQDGLSDTEAQYLVYRVKKGIGRKRGC